MHADTQKIGYGPSWSPDATQLAYYDGVQSRIVVLDVQTGGETYLTSRVGIVGTWTPDGSQMIYFDTQIIENNPVNVLFRVDFETQDILPFFDPQPTDGNYSNPVLSPDGAWIAMKVKPFDGGPGDQIWVTPADGRFATVATDEPDLLLSNIGWDPTSTRLIFYRVRLGVADRAPEVWMWNMQTAALTLLAENASAPAWLP